MKELKLIITILETKDELQPAFNLRCKVFVKEQNIPKELEFDEKDNIESTIHIGCFEYNHLIGVARLIDMDKNTIHIGRVVVEKNCRKRGIGSKLILGCEEIAIKTLKLPFKIKLGAQIQAEKFYENLGYKRVNNKIYLEAGIQHIDMEKTIS